MASGLTQLRGITDPVWNRLLKGLQKFSGVTAPQNFTGPTPPPVVDYYILLEDGFYILQEDSSKILVE